MANITEARRRRPSISRHEHHLLNRKLELTPNNLEFLKQYGSGNTMDEIGGHAVSQAESITSRLGGNSRSEALIDALIINIQARTLEIEIPDDEFDFLTPLTPEEREFIEFKRGRFDPERKSYLRLKFNRNFERRFITAFKAKNIPHAIGKVASLGYLGIDPIPTSGEGTPLVNFAPEGWRFKPAPKRK